MSFSSVSESAVVGLELWITYYPGCIVRRTPRSPIVSKPGSRLPGLRRRRGEACSPPPSPGLLEGGLLLAVERDGTRGLAARRPPADVAGPGPCGPARRVRKRRWKRAGTGRHHAARTGTVSRALGGWAAPLLHHRGNRPEPPGRPGHRQAHDPHCQGEGRGSGGSTEGQRWSPWRLMEGFWGSPGGEITEGPWRVPGEARRARSRELSGSVPRVSIASIPQLGLPGALACPLRFPAHSTPFSPFRLGQPDIVRRKPPDQDLWDPAPSCLSYVTLSILS